MEITVSQEQGSVSVYVVKLTGHLDGQSFQQLIAKARELYEEGAREFLLDLTDLAYISSAGLVALHTITLLTNGEPMPDTEKSWSTLKSMDKTRSSGKQKHIKLFSPRPEIINVLDMVGFSEFFETFTDKQAALASF